MPTQSPSFMMEEEENPPDESSFPDAPHPDWQQGPPANGKQAPVPQWTQPYPPNGLEMAHHPMAPHPMAPQMPYHLPVMFNEHGIPVYAQPVYMMAPVPMHDDRRRRTRKRSPSPGDSLSSAGSSEGTDDETDAVGKEPKKALKRTFKATYQAQIVMDLPKAEEEASATFEEIDANKYLSKELGRCKGQESGMVCDCKILPSESNAPSHLL